MCRVYDKIVESKRDILKQAILQQTRWGGMPEFASRVEFQIERAKLAQFGVDTVEDWIEKRSDVVDRLTSTWLRLTDGPVDRKHAYRTPIHPVWEKTREAFFGLCNAPSGLELRPLRKLEIDYSRQVRGIVGIFTGAFARVGKDIPDNETFYREVEFSLRDVIGDRDISAEINRKALELGTTGI
jgi:hypothetical protein